MKFSNSDRVFHDIKFTPPCNYYNLEQKQDKKVLYGSLAGPRLADQTKNTFGSQKRFDEGKMKRMPGPGQYFEKKKEIIYDFKRDLSNPKKFLKNTFRISQQNPSIPSIPYKIIDEQNLDEEDKMYIRQLNLSQNPAKASRNIRKQEPSFSFAKSPRKILPQIQQNKKQTLANKTKQLYSESEVKSEKQRFEPIQEEKEIKKQQENRNTLVAINETIRKASKKRNQIIYNIGSDFVPSLELIDLMSKMRTKYTPGPGFYNPNNNSFSNEVDNLIETGNKGAVFSSVKRFNADKKDLLGPGSYDVQNNSFSKKGGLMGREKRAILNMKQKKDIEYRFYINPDTEPTINSNTNIQRSSSCTTFRRRNLCGDNQISGGFGSSSRRFSVASSLSKDDDKRSQVSQFQLQKKKTFKVQLKARLKKLNFQDRRSTKEDSGLLGISTMATMLD